jgi:hypothetical protein
MQGIPPCAALQRIFLARQCCMLSTLSSWQCIEHRAIPDLLVVDGGVPGMAAVLVPFMKQCLLVHHLHAQIQAHDSR